MAHIGQKLALCPVGANGLLARRVQLLHLATREAVIFGKDQQQRHKDDAVARESQNNPLGAQMRDRAVDLAIGHYGNKIPFRIRQRRAVQMPAPVRYIQHAGIAFVPVHGRLKLRNIPLGLRSALHMQRLPHTVEVIVLRRVLAADDIAAVAPDDVRIHQRAVHLQRERRADVIRRQAAHKGHALAAVLHLVRARHAQQHHLARVVVRAHGHLAVARRERMVKGPRVVQMHRAAVQHFK